MSALKLVTMMMFAFFTALGAMALEEPLKAKLGGKLNMQIFTDLQLIDEVESLNEGEAAKVWIRSSDDDAEDVEIKGVSKLGS